MTIRLPREIKSVQWEQSKAEGEVSMVVTYRGLVGLVMWAGRRVRRALGV